MDTFWWDSLGFWYPRHAGPLLKFLLEFSLLKKVNERKVDLVDSGRWRLKKAGNKMKHEQVSPTLISIVLVVVSEVRSHRPGKKTYAQSPTLTML